MHIVLLVTGLLTLQGFALPLHSVPIDKGSLEGRQILMLGDTSGPPAKPEEHLKTRIFLSVPPEHEEMEGHDSDSLNRLEEAQ